MAGELEYQYRVPDANAASVLTGTLATTRTINTGSFFVDVTGFPANTVIQPGDYLSASGGTAFSPCRQVLDGSGAGRVFGQYITGTTWTSGNTLTVYRPLPANVQAYFAEGGVVIPTNGSLTPSFDVYLPSAPYPGAKLWVAMDMRLRGTYGAAGLPIQMLLRNWADTSTLQTFAWSTLYPEASGGTAITDTTGAWSDYSAAFEVTAGSLTDWRYKVRIYCNPSSASWFGVMYVNRVSFYWADASLNTFNWSYEGAMHKAWDFASDTLFERSEPLVNYRVSARERDPANPFELGARCDLRDRGTQARPRIVAWRRWLDLRSTDLPLPELELDNRTSALTRLLVAKASV